MSEMRIMTVRQPWAWAIIHGGKDVENRVRNIAGAYRGPVAIHVAREIDTHAIATPSRIHPEFRTAAERYIKRNRDSLKGSPWMGHIGHIIGVVDLVDVHRANGDNPGELNLCAPYGVCSTWAERTGHHLVLANPRPLAEPIPFKGALGLRHLDDDTTARIEVQL